MLCNGVQNLAAITRDHLVAPHVGLIYTEERGDVYQYVIDGVIHTITKEDTLMGAEWLTSQLMTRSLSKTPVMTRSYSAKLYGIKTGIQEFIEDAGKAEHFDDYFKAGNWMGEQIWDSMNESLKGPMAFMEWSQACAGIMAKANLPLIWDNPIGMRCSQSPFTTKVQRIQTKVNGKTTKYQLRTPTNIINRAKMMSSSSPNLIHSCDASHLLLTTDRCDRDGIVDFAMVHDSFGSHPDDTAQLLLNTKLSWVDMYEKNWMQIWYEQWSNQLGSNDLPRPEEFVTMGTLEAKSVMESDFFFA